MDILTIDMVPSNFFNPKKGISLIDFRPEMHEVLELMVGAAEKKDKEKLKEFYAIYQCLSKRTCSSDSKLDTSLDYKALFDNCAFSAYISLYNNSKNNSEFFYSKFLDESKMRLRIINGIMKNYKSQ